MDGLFVAKDAKLIKAIPLSQAKAEDVLFWPYTNNGVYSCKSGYRFLKEEAEMEVTNQVPPLRDKHVWKAIWSMQVPQKVKNFIWRACRNAMPTKHALMRRTVILEGDSMEVIQALRENDQSLTPTGLLLEDVRMLSQNFEQLLYSHTKRDGNAVAHSMH